VFMLPNPYHFFLSDRTFRLILMAAPIGTLSAMIGFIVSTAALASPDNHQQHSQTVAIADQLAKADAATPGGQTRESSSGASSSEVREALSANSSQRQGATPTPLAPASSANATPADRRTIAQATPTSNSTTTPFAGQIPVQWTDAPVAPPPSLQPVPSALPPATQQQAIPSAPLPLLPAPAPTLAQTAPATPQATPLPAPYSPRLTSNAPLTPPSLTLQGVFQYYDSDVSARARAIGIYPVTPNLLFGGTLDFTTGNAFGDDGININELYVAASLPNAPNLRFVLGQIDLTSYFDRNSFAKDNTTQFFSPIFQTNPALGAANIGSRPGLLVNWSVTDNLEARAVAFSSARSIGDFALDGFAGEVGLRTGNAIIRGTYVSSRDLDAPGGASRDRLEAYGVNAELYIPEINLGLFARYGRLNNQTFDFSADTYSVGANLLDVFQRNDRLGLAYGRNLSNESARRRDGDRVPDALELFYDFAVLPNLRLGLSIQQANDFSDTIAGFRLRTEFNVTPRSGL
jgi:hypothetical protein